MRTILALLALATGCTTNNYYPAADMAGADLPAPAGDMAERLPGDMAAPPDLAPPPPPGDMAESSPDLAPGPCGAAVGQMCCPHNGMIPDCQLRDENTGFFIGCDQDLGSCILCGALNQPCCPGNVCHGSTCAGPSSDKHGYCT